MEGSFLEKSLLHSELFACSVEHLLLVSARCDETIDFNLEFLADPMGSSYGLQVVLRIPIRVKDDDDSSFGQIDAQATCSGRQ